MLNLLLIQILLSRNLSLADYGRYHQVWLVLNIAIPLFLFGLPAGISYFLPRVSGRDRHSFMLQYALLILCLAGVCAVGLYSLAPVLAPWLGGPELIPLLRVAAFIGLGLIASGFWEPFLIVYDRHKWLAGSLMLFALVYLAAVLFGRFVAQSLLWIFISLAVFATFRVTVVFAVLFRLTQPTGFRFRRDWFRRQVTYALPIGLRDGVGVLSRWSDKLIITTYGTSAQYAHYVNGALELPLVGLLADSVVAVVLPEFSAAFHRRDTAEILRLMHLTARRLALFVFPAAAFSIVVGPDFTTALFGAEYRLSGDYFRVFAMILPVRFATGAYVLLAAGRPERVLYGAILDIVLAVSLGIALYPWIGPFGPAVALVFSTYCQVTYNFWQAGRALHTPVRALAPWRVLGRVALVSALSGAFAGLFLLFQHPMVNLVVAGAAFAAAFGVLGFGLRLLDSDEREAVGQVLARVADVIRSRRRRNREGPGGGRQ